MEYSMINEPSPSPTQASRGINLILVEDGSLHEYPYTKFVSPISLKKAPFLIDFIEKEFGINKNSQLILRGEDGKQLESSMNLEEFFHKDRTVYVYLTKGQRQENAQDDFEVIGSVSLEKKWSDHGADLLQAMFEHLGPNIKESLDPHVANCYDDLIVAFSELKGEMTAVKEGSIKIKRQKDSEAVLKRSLINYYIEKKRQFDETLAQQEAKINNFQEYIDNFDSCIEKLSKKEIEPQLAEEDKKHLVDYFDLEKLKRSKGVYEKNQIKIQQKAQEIKDEILQYDNQLKNIEETLPDQSDIILELLQVQENLFADAQDTNIQGIQQMLASLKGKPSQKQLSDFVKKQSETVIPKLKVISQNLVEICKKLEEYLKENALKLRDLISDITNIRVLIKGKIYNKLKVFCSLVEKHEEGMFNLEIVEKFPLVYEESLQEIRRRSIFKKDYMTMLGILESFGNSENRLRQEFLEMYQQYLPKSFCPFLSKTFLQLKFDNVKRMIDQDLGVDLNDLNENVGQETSEDDIFKLLKNLEEALQSKQARNQELESLVQPLREENEQLKEQLNERALNVENIRKLFGATGFQERIEGILGSYKKRFNEKMDQMEKKLSVLNKAVVQSKTITEIQSDEELRNTKEELEKLKKDFVALKIEKEELADDLEMVRKGQNIHEEAKMNETMHAVNAVLEKNDEEFKKLREKIQEKKLEKQTTVEKDLEIERLNDELKKKEDELNDLRKKTNVDFTNSLCEASTTKVMLDEIGGSIRDLYAKLFAGDNIHDFKNDTYDLKEILENISRLVLHSMAKIDDYNIGDKVIAVRLKKSKYFVILRKGMADLGTMHLYKSENEKLADAIIGEIEEFGVYQEDDITGTYANGVILVKIINIEPLASIPL